MSIDFIFLFMLPSFFFAVEQRQNKGNAQKQKTKAVQISLT